MCGIVGYIGNKQAQDVLLGGLKRLEYRGYDSAGIATFGSRGAATVLRTKGKVQELVDVVATHQKPDQIGIGHTRWATHGEPSKRNAHPHVVDTIHVVHKGIIENYQDLREMLKKHDYDFKSDTDTEVLAALISYISRETEGLIETVRAALGMVVGAYGIAVLDTRYPDEIVVARNGSPLILGVGNGEVFIASDASALLGYTKQVVYLQDGELAVCTTSGVELSDMTSNSLVPTVETLEMDLEAVQKKGYEHFLLKEIHDQPDTVRATLRGRINPTEHTARLGGINMTAGELREVRHIMIVGCGTAYYAGVLAKYYLEQLLGDVVVSVEIASELRYRSFVAPAGTLALIVSQSGETADTLACLDELKRRGVRCIGVVNAVGSSIARAVDGGVYVHVGAEISVASTKAFTSQVVAMLLFGLTAADAKGLDPERRALLIDELNQLPGEIERLLVAHEAEIRKIAADYAHYNNALYVGRDTLYPVALEGALKLKEISYVHAEGYPAGELKHGPIALVDDSFFEVFYLLDSWLYEKSQSNLIEMNARGAHCIAITNTTRKVEAETVVRVHSKLEQLTPLLFNVLSQLLAYYIAAARGSDVDQPRNLAKSVTVE